jgi:hypothetical protein
LGYVGLIGVKEPLDIPNNRFAVHILSKNGILKSAVHGLKDLIAQVMGILIPFPICAASAIALVDVRANPLSANA